jgi:hypothetical protein
MHGVLLALQRRDLDAGIAQRTGGEPGGVLGGAARGVDAVEGADLDGPAGGGGAGGVARGVPISDMLGAVSGSLPLARLTVLVRVGRSSLVVAWATTCGWRALAAREGGSLVADAAGAGAGVAEA